MKLKKWALLFAMMLALQLFGTSFSDTVAQAPGNGAADATARPAKVAPLKSASNGVYLIQIKESPVVDYNGGVPGLKATAPKSGAKIDPYSAEVVNYVNYLDSRHNTLLNGVGGGKKLYDYRYSFSGFAAQLTLDQAKKLAADPGVTAVYSDEVQQIDTASTPKFLGLSDAGGLWSQLGGTGNAGDGVIVGVVDSGIWPENPSFSDRTGTNGNGTQDGKLDFQQIPGWHGKCTPGEAFNASNCNQKLIGAQWFNSGYGGDSGVKATFPYEFASARGASSHGSHTASTAAGNYGVEAVVDGSNLGKISGMAPHARIAVYKVCWGIGDAGGCFNSDSVAAIDQAVADGVDVINFSISGSLTSFMDPVEVAFLYAARANIFVAASAGNSGPAASTVAHNSPWLTTVAAGSHDRQYVATAKLGNGITYSGIGLGAAVPSAPVVVSTNAGLPGANATALRLCFDAIDNGGVAVLDPAKVAGKIVVCDRGTNARVNKSLAVKNAGGVGMILTNTSTNSLNADLHFVPTVHVDEVAGAAIKLYVNNITSPTASLTAGTLVSGALAPDVASFSSRGPALAGGGDLLKPDIMAPGVDILAAVSPVENSGRSFDFLSGTSMSSPHIAGIAALMKQAHPNWTPAMIKSALMTTASQTRNDGTPIPGNPFGFGAGEVTPNKGTDPGLVYNSGWNDWLGFLCGTGQYNGTACATLKIDPSNLNYPSIAIGDLPGAQTVKRTVTNVSNKSETYAASASVDKMNAVVTPSSFTLAPGASKTFTVTLTNNGANLNSYTFGALTLTGSLGHVVRSPIAIRPVALGVPASVSGTGGAISYSVAFGYTNAFSATGRGLVPATITPGTVQDDPGNSFTTGGPGTVAINVSVPADTSYARFELFDADVLAGSDIDLYVYKGTTLVGSSGSGTAAEQVNLLNPTAGDYTVYVHGWQTTGGAPSPFKLHTWLLGNTAAGNMTVTAPTSATLGGTGTISLNFSGLTAGAKYLGSVAYSGIAGLPNPTIVRVDVP